MNKTLTGLGLVVNLEKEREGPTENSKPGVEFLGQLPVSFLWKLTIWTEQSCQLEVCGAFISTLLIYHIIKIGLT